MPGINPAATAMPSPPIYSDPLVTLTEQQVRVKCYYLWGGDKVVRWEDVEFVSALEPTIWNGKWRLWGTTWFRTWFAADFDRPNRQTIFTMRSIRSTCRSDSPSMTRTREGNLRCPGLIARPAGADAAARPPPAPHVPLSRSPVLYVLLLLLALLEGDAIHFYPRCRRRSSRISAPTGAPMAGAPKFVDRRSPDGERDRVRVLRTVCPDRFAHRSLVGRKLHTGLAGRNHWCPRVLRAHDLSGQRQPQPVHRPGPLARRRRFGLFLLLWLTGLVRRRR